MRATPLVDNDHAVAIAIECETNIGLVINDETLQRFGRGGPAALVYVLAVGLVEVREDLRTRLCENRRRNAVRGPVRTVERDTHAVEPRRLPHEKVLVLLHQPPRVTDQADAALGGTRKGVVSSHQAFDPVLDAIRQLLRAVIEELDAVVWRGVVRRADDGTGHELICLREIREPGCWNMPDQAHLHADRTQPRGERALEHAAASAGVAADDHPKAPPAAGVPRRPA